MSLDSNKTHYTVMERQRYEERADSDISTAVVLAVARASGTDPMELPPLYDHVDPDALDALVAHNTERSAQTNLAITFLFTGYEVTIRADGEIIVSEPVELN